MTTDTGSRRERVYLAGFMGSGKSTIGPILANTIGYDFVDLDGMIEQAQGKSVSRIFAERGEAFFRSLERELIGGLSTQSRLVVSLGGGTLVDPVSFRTIVETGILVYIKLNPDVLFKRLQRRSDRPLLMDQHGNRLSGDELRRRIKQLHESREPLYARADVTIDADDRRVGLTVDRVARALSPFLKG
jgi:shikimate kinase